MLFALNCNAKLAINFLIYKCLMTKMKSFFFEPHKTPSQSGLSVYQREYMR